MPAGGAGSRDRLIRIERASVSQSPTSGDVTIDQWDLVERVWAGVRAPSGRELMQAQGIVAKVDTVLNIRWRNDFSASEAFLIVHEARRYDITAVLEPPGSPRRSELDVFAVARAEEPANP